MVIYYFKTNISLETNVKDYYYNYTIKPYFTLYNKKLTGSPQKAVIVSHYINHSCEVGDSEFPQRQTIRIRIL